MGEVESEDLTLGDITCSDKYNLKLLLKFNNEITAVFTCNFVACIYILHMVMKAICAA